MNEQELHTRLQRAEEALRMILTHDPADGQCDNGYSPEYVAREALTHPDPESEWKQYKRTNVVEMRPYILGEDLAGISVSDQDDPPNDHGMVARNPKNHADQWYVARAYFEENFEELQPDHPEAGIRQGMRQRTMNSGRCIMSLTGEGDA